MDRLVQAVRKVRLRPLLRSCDPFQQHAGSANALLMGVQRRRLNALLKRDGRLVQETPGHHDRAVGLQEFFGLMVLDWPLLSRSEAFWIANPKIPL